MPNFYYSPNPAILSPLAKHVLLARNNARILDVGCGCGANARALKEQRRDTRVIWVEPSARAVELARRACDEVFHGTFDDWSRAALDAPPFDAVLLSEVLEHVANHIPFLLAAIGSLWVVSVPNYAVWYNRVRTLIGVQSYARSGLWDRTHLRFHTRRTARELLEYCGFSVVDEACTPSLVQSGAPFLRKVFERDVQRGEHLALADSRAYDLYRRFLEPLETRACAVWPELLAFQIVHAARLAPA
jgi:SAM-dependent methyltransferase